MNTRWAAVLLFGAALLADAAAPVTWDGGGGTPYWDTPGNWNPDGVPGPGDDVSITNGYSVILTNVQAVGSLLVTNATLTFGGYDTVQLTATNVTVAGAGGRITHTNYSTNAVLLPEHRVHLVCTNLTVATNAVITVNGRGFLGGLASASHPNGFGPAPGYGQTGGGGGGHGGVGAKGYVYVPGGTNYDSALVPTNAGSGGGASHSVSPTHPGSAGGGVIRLAIANAFTNNGIVSANGEVVGANQEQGGGAGGSIHVTCGALAGSGAFTANGGYNTVTTTRGGGGGGGRIAIYGSLAGFAGSFSASPGTGNQNLTAATAAKAGTLHIEDIPALGGVWTGDVVLVVATNVARDSLTVKCTGVDMLPGCALWITNLLSVTNTPFLAESNNTTTVGQMELRGGAIFDLRYASLEVTNGDLTLYNSATLYLRETATTTVSRTILVTNSANLILVDAYNHPTGSVLPFTVSASDVFVSTGAAIHADGCGFPGGSPGVPPHPLTNGPGYATGPNYAAGAGFGGRGGKGVLGVGVPGVAYGSNDAYCTYTTPTFAGSGGGPNPANPGGAGGGVVRLLVTNGTLTVNGRVSADGANGAAGNTDTGGGSGGSVYITAHTVAGAGYIQAEGGDGQLTNRGGAGAGGRVAVYYVSCPFIAGGTLSVAPGSGCTDGADYPAGTGSVYTAMLPGYVALEILGSPARCGQPAPNGYGIWGFLPGSTVTNGVASPADQAGGVRYHCIGYLGAGDLASGSGTQAVFTITSGATLTWLWTNVYELALGTGVHGSVSASSGWYTQAVAVVISATSDPGYYFTQWSGDIPPDQVMSNPATVVMDRPRSIHAQFGKDGGENKTWVGGTGAWDDVAGWVSPGMPGKRDAVTLTNGQVTLGVATEVASLVVSNATLILSNWSTRLSVPAMTLRANAAVTHAAVGSSAALHRVNLACDVLEIASGAAIHGDGAGFQGGTPGVTPNALTNGPGYGSGPSYGAGAGYGGRGGYAVTWAGVPGVTYGSNDIYGSWTAPIYPGSGGGPSSVRLKSGGNGGGSVRLNVFRTLIVNGRVSADGVNWTSGDTDSGGGSGGSVYITTRALDGAGIIRARGGDGQTTLRGGAGGGGRIAVECRYNHFTGTYSATNGVGYQNGQPGTIDLRLRPTGTMFFIR